MKRLLILAFTVVAVVLSGLPVSAGTGNLKPVAEIEPKDRTDARYDVKGCAAENLRHYGIIKGDEHGDLHLSKTLTRQELAVILAGIHGSVGEAEKFPANTDYKDAEDFAPWARSFIAYARAKGWMQGSAGKFMPHAKISGEQAATVILKTLGYRTEWGTGVARTRQMGIDMPARDALTRKELFTALWRAISAPIMEDGRILGLKFGVLPELKKLPPRVEVESIKAPNMTEMYITYNQMVKPLEAETNIRVVPRKFKVEMQKNERTFKLTFEKPLINFRTYTVETLGAESKNHPTVGKEAQTLHRVRVEDVNMPEVITVNFVSPREFVVYFTEPIAHYGAVKIKELDMRLDPENATFTGLGTDEIRVRYASPFEKKDSYEFKVYGFKDHAGYENLEKTVIRKVRD